jgi:hypothetical protein
VICIAHYRHKGGTREAVCPAGVVDTLGSSYTATQAYWGTLTSKRPERLSPADIALAAFRLGVKPEAARKAIEMGLFDG